MKTSTHPPLETILMRADLRADIDQLVRFGGSKALERAIQLGTVVQDGEQSLTCLDDFLARRLEPVTRILTICKFYDGEIEIGVSSDDPMSRHRMQSGERRGR